jgi:hypothetical protein
MSKTNQNKATESRYFGNLQPVRPRHRGNILSGNIEKAQPIER